ncbi:MAG: serine/threonine-protein phosphatase [Lachnospiraceae bacterium]|nr:serine/threonine-protein phosphatase [Lachnospiraceae bacterium]
MIFHVAACSDVGIKRKVNQDSYWVKQYATPLGDMVIAVVCDGMGGLEHGEIASATVVRAFCEWADRRLPNAQPKLFNEEEISEEWDEVIAFQNDALMDYGEQNQMKLGTTLTALLLTQDKYFIGHVGDSRCYRITDHVEQLTQDHSFVASQVALGNMTEEEAKVDKRRNVLLQCVGAVEEVHPQYLSGALSQETVFMLCSDGFHHNVATEELLGYLSPAAAKDMAHFQMNVEFLIEMDKQRKEKDNITSVAVAAL